MTELRSRLRRIAARSGFAVDDRIPLVRSFLTGGLTVVVYHEVTDRPSEFQRISGGFTTPGFFEQQLDWICERFTPIAPIDLPQLGGRMRLPGDAALITFDDAWAGVFRAALPILASRGIPSLCFLNMATAQGSPDLAAVRRYERITLASKRSRLDDDLDTGEARQVLLTIEASYGEDEHFRRFQGDTATFEDVAQAPGPVWLASHLSHHWDVDKVSSDVFTESARHNCETLESFSNVLPAIATPYGRNPSWLVDRVRGLGMRALFVATGGQNRDPGAFVLDRLQLEPAPSGPEDWWWAAHRRRLFGSLAS